MERDLNDHSSPTNKSSYIPSKVYLGRIKIGANIFQDQFFGQWPNCKPPFNEYTKNGYDIYFNQAKDPNMIFEMKLTESRVWFCKANGYGMLKSQGDIGEYGNGGIYVYGDVEIIGEKE